MSEPTNKLKGSLKNKDQYKELSDSSISKSSFKEYAIAFFEKYPNPKLSLVGKAYTFGYKLIDNDKLVYFRIKYTGGMSRFFSNHGIEKVIIDLKNKVMETIEISTDNKFKIPQSHIIDRLCCFYNQDKEIQVNKFFYSFSHPNFVKKKLMNYGRKLGDEVMEDLVIRLRLNFDLN